jgi:hypothetical protein
VGPALEDVRAVYISYYPDLVMLAFLGALVLTSPGRSSWTAEPRRTTVR